MKAKSYCNLLVLVFGSALVGCASYAPSLVKLNPSGPNIKKAVAGDLTLYVEEYATPEKSQRAFDTDMANESVLPLLISVENSSRDAYEVKAMDILVRGDAPLKALTVEETAGKAGRSGVGRALGWSMIVPIIAIPVAVAASAIHTSKVNDQIVHDFVAKSFTDGEIMPTKERSGFVFFELTDASTDLAKLTLEMTAKNITTGEFVKMATNLPARAVKTEPADKAEQVVQEAKSQE